MLSIDPQKSLYRFKKARNELGQHAPDGYLVGQLKTKPLDASYPEAEIKWGSHFDQNPSTEDRVEIWNCKPLGTGHGELIHQEIYIQRTERRGWKFTKTPMLHCCQVMIKTGGAVMALAISSIDLNTGQVVKQQEGQEAARTMSKNEWWDPPRNAAHDRESMKGWKPEPLPESENPEWVKQTREEVTRLADALEGKSGGAVTMDGKAVTVGGVRVPRRGG